MNLNMYFKPAVLILLIFCLKISSYGQHFTMQQIESYWQAGKTLPVEVALDYPLPEQPVQNDNGLNVLIDIAHQCSFEMMWRTQSALLRQGFRVASSQATINTVLDPDGLSRVRIHTNPDERIYPFAWHPNFDFNVIITSQTNMEAQKYLPEEIDAIRDFVRDGGGLVILASPQQNLEGVPDWSLNTLCRAFGVSMLNRTDVSHGIRHLALEAGDNFEVIEKGDEGLPVKVRGRYGNGYVVVSGSLDLSGDARLREVTDEMIRNRSYETLGEFVQWASSGKKPVGGEPRLPQPHSGGGGIYPELEQQMDDIVLYYAHNQIPELIRTVEVDVPKAKDLVEQWLPSKPTMEPMYLILSAGSGGGWAVNAYRPKENGIISLDPFGILSIFAHELAHTMAGPVNAYGNVAGITPDPFQNRGESHAGWFQGKVDAVFDNERLNRANRNCNSFFERDTTGNLLDMAGNYREWSGYTRGLEWTKSWYVWQKLDDRYGPTWYPRWRWVQHTRWNDEPDRRLTWEEMVEDMSIAVGEDLFPFFGKLGTTLSIKRLEQIEFQGEILELDVAPIEITPAGNVNLDEIGDYTKPINIRKP